MLEGFENILKKDGGATLTWRNDATNSMAITFAEDSGYDSNLADRVMALAKECSSRYIDPVTKAPKTDNLPEFDAGNVLIVSVQVLGRTRRLPPLPAPPVISPAPAPPEIGPIVYSASQLRAMNKTQLSAILGEDAGERTNPQLIEAILAKQGE